MGYMAIDKDEDQAPIRNVVIPEWLRPIIGEQDPGTRIFRAEGDNGEGYIHWWDALAEAFPRGLVSPGGGCPYAGVTRAAIHKAMATGRITAFMYHRIVEKRGVLGAKLVRENPYGYLPVVELRFWRMELEERMKSRELGATKIRMRNLLALELEGEKPDWDGLRLYAHPKGRKVNKPKGT